MALVRSQSEKRLTAFSRIHQAIQEDDLWTVAWYMRSFLLMPHVLSNLEEKILLAKYDFRVKLFEEKLDLLKEMARGHAREDFEDWLQNGKVFGQIEQQSHAKHQQEVGKLLVAISTYGRSVAYLYEIINMKVALPESPIEKDTYKLQAMGRSPGSGNLQKSATSFNGWVLIRREEAGAGDYQGGEWTII
ncbi:hypothetical protein PTTG_27287 [Puccinia triticina 1-1 BBBD Race 1]|uniref:Uncharacterized protein n=2 Tax=Puccinia triticina TaxID=208348 RepID=A0A180GL31_PUCT1|nr:uncharacterized protein PtA15_3A545 [Puccinia triticina]OAV93477.1 hypothetical protein PTTG_27287 [Puccinia triticina 1-1 BBBD Race 1]WAQ83176.1 hypothetical protein PtA15_3A545 [Puccinia triticina]WAR54020.1 hypothetical protein PtB15_3B530 [Puccinia triticina]